MKKTWEHVSVDWQHGKYQLWANCFSRFLVWYLGQVPQFIVWYVYNESPSQDIQGTCTCLDNHWYKAYTTHGVKPMTLCTNEETAFKEWLILFLSNYEMPCVAVYEFEEQRKGASNNRENKLSWGWSCQILEILYNPWEKIGVWSYSWDCSNVPSDRIVISSDSNDYGTRGSDTCAFLHCVEWLIEIVLCVWAAKCGISCQSLHNILPILNHLNVITKCTDWSLLTYDGIDIYVVFF